METLHDRIRFDGLNVLVTGGSKGIGRAAVATFAALGANAFFTYRSNDASVASLCENAEKPGTIMAIECDATTEGAAEHLRDAVEAKTGQLDILVNNVGDAIGRAPFVSSDDQLWRQSLELNLMTVISTSRAMIPMLEKSRNGSIINVSSIAGRTGGVGDSMHYGAAKAALNAVTGALAKELKGTGIRVNGVAPSAIDTDFQARHSSPERLARVGAETPLGRIGTATEVADVIVFLASRGAAFISGETIHITGGR